MCHPRSRATRVIPLMAVPLIVLLLAAPAPTVTIRVDHAGGGDYLTISEGVGAAVAGDTVLVAPGTYAGQLNREIEAHTVTIMSEGGSDMTVIDCEGSGFAFETYGSNLIGFTLLNGMGSESTGFGTVLVRDGRIVDCVFADGVDKGLVTYGTNSVSDCVFLDHESYGAQIDPGGKTTITGCLFQNGTSTGLLFYNYEHCDRHPPHEVSDCVFRGNSSGALGAYYESPLIRGCLFEQNVGGALSVTASFAEIRRCTIVGNQSGSRGVFNFSSDVHFDCACTITNCIVAFNSCFGLVTGTPGDSEFHRNCIFGNAGGDGLPGRIESRANLYEDPLFCDWPGGDYTLCGDSPCLAENDPLGTGMGIDCDAPGCDPCGSSVGRTSWGGIKALYRE